MRTSTKIVKTSIVLLIVSFLGTLCYAAKKPIPENIPYGGTLVIGTYNAPTIINPILTSHSVSAVLIPLIFNGLVRINYQEEIEPDLAESWTISDDQLTYTFHLCKNVTFHDGHELTAEDVAFTYNQIINTKFNSQYKSHFELVEHFEAVDKYTFRVALKKPLPSFLNKMIRYIVPKHLLEGQSLESASFNYSPIGTGPFKFKTWNREYDQIRLEANTHYFEGRPYLDRIIVKTYHDSSSVWAAFLRDEVDLINFINRQDYIAIKDNPAFKVHSIDLQIHYAMVYNLKDPILHNKEIRKAITQSINKKLIMDMTSDAGIESTGPFHPEFLGSNPDFKPLEYNPYKAKMTLMHQGWQDSQGTDVHGGEHGIRKKGGKELELRLLVDQSNEDYKLIAKIIRQELSEVGIKTKVLLYQDEKELTPEYLEKHKPQAWLRFFAGQKSDGEESARDWYSLSSRRGKLWPYKNENVDQLFELARSTHDKNKAIAIYKQIHKIVYEDYPAYFLYFPATFHAISARFQNTHEYFSPSTPRYTIKNWFLPEKSE